MNARDILFKTSRLNLSKIGGHFINPSCFGEDLAGWLRIKLADNGVEVSLPGQEDWGWYLRATYDGDSYFLGMNAIEKRTLRTRTMVNGESSSRRISRFGRGSGGWAKLPQTMQC
jgi:hypothetical protein